MIHLTLNTGHVSESPRASVGPEAVSALLPLIGGGQLPGPFSAFRVEVGRGDGGATFSLHRGQDILVMCGVAWTDQGAAEVWLALENLYFQLAELPVKCIVSDACPEMPSTLPWLGVVMLPSLVFASRSDVGWIGDWERCFAWTLLASLKDEDHPTS